MTTFESKGRSCQFYFKERLKMTFDGNAPFCYFALFSADNCSLLLAFSDV